MPICRDPLVSQLNALGFNALRVPRVDYVPPALLTRASLSEPVLWGTLKAGFDGLSPPEPLESAQGQLSTTATAAYQKNTAIRLVADFLRINPLQLSGAFDGANRISFHLGKLRVLSTPLAKITDFLLAAQPTPALTALSRSRLFVITEVIQVKALTLVAENASMQRAAIAGSAMDPLLPSADITVDAANAMSGVLVFNATVPHTVGFKAHEIELSAGVLGLVASRSSTGLSHLAGDEPTYEPVIFDEFLL